MLIFPGNTGLSPIINRVCPLLLTDVALDYKIVGKGCAECSLDFSGTKFTVTASYLSDALFELVSGTNHIVAEA